MDELKITALEKEFELFSTIFQADDNQVWEVGIVQIYLSSDCEHHALDNMTEVVSTHPCVAKAFQMGNKSGEN